MLVNYATFTSVSGAVDLLDNIRTTAVSWGWTQEEWLDGVTFDAPNDQWTADVNGGYLALSSSGWGGSQDLIAKVAVDRRGGTGTDYEMQAQMCSALGYDLADSFHPVFSNSLGSSTSFIRGWSLPTTTISQVWLFGNNHYLCAVANIDGVLYTLLEFGSYAMRKVTPLNQDGSISGWVLVGNGLSWDNYLNYDPQGVDGITNIPSISSGGFGNVNIYWESRTISPLAGDAYATVLYTGGTTNRYKTFTEKYNLLFSGADASGRRFIMKNTFLYERLSDSLPVPVSESIGSLVNGYGLTPAQSIYYGPDEYVVFPCCSHLSEMWLAFRVA